MVPIAQALSALAFDVFRLGRLPGGSTTTRRIKHANVTLRITQQNRLCRVAITVPVTGLHQRNLRLYGIQKGRATGSFTAVVRYQQQV